MTFNPKEYSVKSEEKKEYIDAYAKLRGIRYGSFLYSTFKEPKRLNDGSVEFIDRAGLGFPHTDLFGKVCGLKIRAVDPEAEPKFNQRGKPGFYVLENVVDEDPDMFIVESETSAAAFHAYCQRVGRSAVIISFGGINQVPKMLPFKWEYLKDRYLIIDYDGDKKKWEERSATFDHLNAFSLEIALPKGQDLATLSQSSEIDKYLI